ncbi:MAG: hypothetical protein Q8P41_18510 [Pseudomonadota bacterium]|nr:hypothetical protein [Pseudomonadota bacterium]
MHARVLLLVLALDGLLLLLLGFLLREEAATARGTAAGSRGRVMRASASALLSGRSPMPGATSATVPHAT